MPNCYSRVADLKAELQGSGSGTSNDAIMLRVLDRVSRAIDEHCGRHFYSVAAQTILLPEGPRPRHIPQRELWLLQDIINITTLKVDEDGDATYEITLAANTDYWTWPYNKQSNEPIQRLDLNPEGTQIAAWPTSPRAVQLIGKRGYSEETAAAGTLGAAITDTTGTSVTLTSGHDVGVGDTIIVDSEQMDITAVATNTATVTRNVNGTTAATHTNGTAVTRRRFPRPIEQAAVMQAARFIREVQTGYGGSLGNAEVGGYSFRSMYPAIRDLLQPFVLRGV